MQWLLPFVLLFFLPACTTGSRVGREVPTLAYSVTRSHPHDTTAYTEGLLVHEGALYESTGSPEGMEQTRSLFGRVDWATGRIEVKGELDRERYFGEGIAFLQGKLYQLTFKNRLAFVYDARTFTQLDQLKLPTAEGWGLTTDGTHLVMSNGTSQLYYLDPASLRVVKTLKVTSGKRRVTNLNELELINGALFANVWRTNTLVRIDTASGAVTGRLDLSALVREARRQYPETRELNGIAYDAASGRVYVTGKMWPYIYEIRFLF